MHVFITLWFIIIVNTILTASNISNQTVKCSLPEDTSQYNDYLLSSEKHQVNDGKVKWALICLYSAKKPGKIQIRNEKLYKAIKPYSDFHDFTLIVFSEDHIDPGLIKSWENLFKGVAKVKTIDTSINVRIRYTLMHTKYLFENL